MELLLLILNCTSSTAVIVSVQCTTCMWFLKHRNACTTCPGVRRRHIYLKWLYFQDPLFLHWFGLFEDSRWGAGGCWHCSTDCPLVLNKVATFLVLAHTLISQTTLLMSTSVFHPTHDCLVSFWWKGNWLWIAVANDQCVKQFGSSRRRTVFPNPHVKFKLPLVFKMHRNSPCCTSNTGDNAHVCTAVIA